MEKIDDKINPDHQLSIDHIRKSLGHMFTPEFDSDFDILRWLQGYDFDTNLVLTKLKSHLEFRRAFDFKNYQWHPIPQQFTAFGMLGSTKKDNLLVLLECMGRVDSEGVTKSAPMSSSLLTGVSRFETRAVAAVRQREKLTGQQSGLCHIIDLEQMGNNKVSEILNSFLPYGAFFQTHYVEMLKKIILINANSSLYYIWRIMKPFMPLKTQNKIIILSNNWKQEIREHVDPDALPVHWGGTLVDEDGDPMCRSLINVPTKVPSDRYWTPRSDDPSKKSLTQLNIGCGKHEFVSISVEKSNQILKWYYFTNAQFSFGVYWTDDENEFDTNRMQTVFPFIDILAAASKVPEKNSIKCDRIGFYRIRFGNEYAWISKLKVMYKIDLTSDCYDK